MHGRGRGEDILEIIREEREDSRANRKNPGGYWR